MSNNTKLFCLFLKAQKQDKLSEQGYAMAVVSILSIIMFSLLAASLIFSNLAKSRTDAFVDSQSSFAVAESGLNKRAVELQAKLETYSGVTGISDPTKKVDSCFADTYAIPTGKKQSTPTETDDFECRNYSFDSSNNISRVVAKGGGISLDSKGEDNINYVAYTFVEDKTVIASGETSPASTRIQSGTFAGLNAAEYKYVVQSVGRKPIKSGAVDKGGNSTNLSMTFTTRVVPLFQFAIFYNGDLEFNSTSKMRVKGRVHSNANIYVQPAGIVAGGDSVTEFFSIVTSAGNIYNRVDAWDKGLSRTGITRVLLTGNDCETGTCEQFPAFDSSKETFLNTKTLVSDPFSTSTPTPTPTAADNAIAAKVQDGAAGAVKLEVPSPGFTRKRNYFDNKVGLYYARADMRLEMVPDRDATVRPTTGAWTRDKAIIPFNFTSVTTGAANCTFTLPAADTDAAADYIEAGREQFGTRKCNKFTKGQLQSLRQPVLVLKNSTPALESIERKILGGPTGRTETPVTDRPTFPPLLDTPTDPFLTNLDPTVQNKILRALQVALVSTPKPVTLDALGKNFEGSGSVYDTDPNLNSFRAEFKRLVELLFPVLNPASLSSTDTANIRIRTTLLLASPNQIAALRAAWFLPAPIQRVETTNTATAVNPRNSGFYDGREKRWITMLQTNIASLSVWNRDGLYVNADNEVMTSAYVSKDRDLVFTSANADDGYSSTLPDGSPNLTPKVPCPYFTSGLAFDRSAVDATKTSTSTANLQSLGLGSSDRTEGGLIIHASVSDDLDGDGTMDDEKDVTVDKADTNRILKKKPNNDNYLDPKTGAVVVIDYHRKYPGKDIKQSPFAFAFNGGNYLPSALTLSSDQSIYIQGNFNNNAAPISNSITEIQNSDRLAASVVADTITVLSNECVSDDLTLVNGVPASQLKCGVDTSTGVNLSDVRNPMAINAAFLSNTDLSIGNYPNGGKALSELRYSGGVNNYIRLLENWANTYALNYGGSLISLGTPLEYSGEYVSGGGEADRAKSAYYNIPIRNFSYDTKFDKNESVPPLTPRASYVQQSGFNRKY